MTGDVLWTGGAYVPGVDASGGANGNAGRESWADMWWIDGKLTLDLTKASKPIIKPQLLAGAPGVQPTGTWFIVKYDTVAINVPNGVPNVDAGYTVNNDAGNSVFKVTK